MTGKARIRLLTAVALLVGLVLLLTPKATGLPAHEWAGLLIIVPLVMHIVIDWRWVVTTTTRFFTSMPGRTRFNYLWDWLFFLLITIAFFSGVVISEAALPAVGIEVEIDLFWTGIHTLSTRLLMILAGVHLAMHWSWIVGVLQRSGRRLAGPDSRAELDQRPASGRSLVVPVATVALAATLVTLAVLPLARTEWAEALRTNPGVSAEEIGPRPSELGTVLIDLTWVVIPIAVPALLTLGVLRIGRLVRSRTGERAPPGPL